MPQEPDTPLVVTITVEVITYAVYLAWLSVIAAGALYLGIPPLPAIQDAVAVPWQGTAAAVGSGALTIALLRLVYDAIRRRMPQKDRVPEPEGEPEPPPPEAHAPSGPDPSATRRKNKRGRKRSRKRPRKR